MTTQRFLYTLRCDAHNRPVARHLSRDHRPRHRQGRGPRGPRRGRRRGRERRARLGVAHGPRRRRRHGARAVEGLDRGDAADAERSSTSTGCARCPRRWCRASWPARPRRSSRARAGCRSRDDDGVVVAGIAASGATVGPFVDYPGADRAQADRRRQARQLRGPARALRARPPVRGPARRRRGSAGSPPTARCPTSRGSGMADPPPASAQPEHEWALALADRAIAAAARRAALRIAVAIVDRRGDPIQQDCMDGAPTAAPFVAEAVAAAAATFQLPSEEMPGGCGARAARTAVAAVPGGLPVAEGGVAGLGIAGAAARGLPRDRRGGAGCEGLRRRLRRDRRPVRRAPRDAVDVEVWAYDVSAEHVAPSTATGCGSTAGPTARVQRPHRRRARSRRASSGSSPRRRRSPSRRSPRPRTCSPTAPSAACRTGSAARRSIARHVAARDPRRRRWPPATSPRPGVVHMDAPGPTWIGPFEPQPAAPSEVERSPTR